MTRRESESATVTRKREEHRTNQVGRAGFGSKWGQEKLKLSVPPRQNTAKNFTTW